MIEIKGLCKTYTNGKESFEALKDVSMTIEQGEIFGFIGLSGAGKSSLVRCISTLEESTKGEIFVDGLDITKIKGAELREARKKLGLVFQHFNLLMNKTVYDNIAFPLVIAKKPKDFIKKRTLELLEMVGLEDKKDSYPSRLSGGQKQRVGIARALAGDPSIVICDEATSALDPTTTHSILQLIKDINKRMNITFIIITHEMSVIKEVCNRVGVLENGRLIESGNIIDVCVQPKTETAKKFFGSAEIDLNSPIYKSSLKTPGVVIKAGFVGDDSTESYISVMIRKYNIDVSILSGNIEQINDTLVGGLVMKIDGEKESIKSAIQYLTEQKIFVEVIHGEC